MQFTITLLIVILTCIVSISAFNNGKIMDDLIFYPPAVTKRKQWYRFFSCGLIHGDWGHLFFNMFSLYMFGGLVEFRFAQIFGSSGKILYLVMYVLALAACLIPTYLKHKEDYYYRSLGASGAVSAVIFAGLLLVPDVPVGILFIPFVKIPGFLFAPLYILISIAMERRGGDNINHSAHIFGGLFGLGFVIIMGKILADFDAISHCISSIQYYFDNL